MTTDTLIMFAGACVALLPYLGFPNSWDSIFFLVLGVFVIALGIVVRRNSGSSARENTNSHIVEAMPAREEISQEDSA